MKKIQTAFLLLTILVALVSLLVLLRAPTGFLWRLSVAVTEFPHIFIIASVTMLTIAFFMSRYRHATILLCLFSLCLFSLPLVAVHKRSAGLEEGLAKAFGPADHAGGDAFSLYTLFAGNSQSQVQTGRIGFTSQDGYRLDFDFYPAITKTPAPCIVVVHGGSWASGDSREFPELNHYLAGRGYHVAAMNYRLAPQFSCPAPVEDIRYLLHYLNGHAKQMGIDTARYVLLGRSAGAQIALLAGYTLDKPCIKGVVDFYGPADMVWAATAPGNPWIMDTDKVLSEYVGGIFSQAPEKFRAASPLANAKPSSPPTLIIHGEQDVLVSFRHSIKLHQRLDSLGVRNYFLDLPLSTHACDYNINGPSGQLSTFALLHFLEAVCKNKQE